MGILSNIFKIIQYELIIVENTNFIFKINFRYKEQTKNYCLNLIFLKKKQNIMYILDKSLIKE